MSLSLKNPCRMSLRPKKVHVAVSMGSRAIRGCHKGGLDLWDSPCGSALSRHVPPIGTRKTLHKLGPLTGGSSMSHVKFKKLAMSLVVFFSRNFHVDCTIVICEFLFCFLMSMHLCRMSFNCDDRLCPSVKVKGRLALRSVYSKGSHGPSWQKRQKRVPSHM